MATQPDLISIPFANSGAKNTIPQTTTVLGKASLANGFPTETSMPLEDGGIPPRREDFNGMLYWLSTFAMYQQAGGLFTYSPTLDYNPPSIVYYNGDLWWCLQANGASTVVKTPSDANNSYWIKFKSYISSPLDAYPVGAYYISSVSTSPAELFGGTWVEVRDRMILAAGTTYTAGALTNPKTGGSETKKLTPANMPSHMHTFTTAKDGKHTHTVSGTCQTSTHTHSVSGTTDGAGSHTHTITTNGNHYHGAMGENYNQSLYGFYDSDRTHVGTSGDLDNDNTIWKTSTDGAHNHTASAISNHTHTFSASIGRSGSHTHTISITVGQAGEHSHTGTTNGAGSGTAFDIMPPYIVAYVWRRTA